MAGYIKIEGVDGESHGKGDVSDGPSIVGGALATDKNGDSFVFVALDKDGDGKADEIMVADVASKGEPIPETLTLNYAKGEYDYFPASGLDGEYWKVEEGTERIEIEWTYLFPTG